ncbi:MAG: sugar transferase [Erysipelotrichales bacterium]|nr:sugar transferase [Erysipelotrichales bacterium]
MNKLNRKTHFIENCTDVIALSLAFFLAGALRFQIMKEREFPLEVYGQIFFIMIVAYVVVNLFELVKEDFLKKSFGDELKSSFKMVLEIVVIMIVFMFITKTSTTYSRLFLGMFAIIAYVLDLALRMLVKTRFFRLFRSSKASEKTIIVGTKEEVVNAIQGLARSNDWRISVAGAVLTDEDAKDEYLNEVPVIGHRENAIEAIRLEEVDSCFILLDYRDEYTRQLIRDICDLGKIVHINIDEQYKIVSEPKKSMDNIGEYPVISYLPVQALNGMQSSTKTLFGLLLAILVLPFFLLVTLLTWILNGLESPGPVLVHRVRVGKNGRRFFQRRFRTMRMDAEKREETGKDPHTVWGKFLNLTHLSGLPMVLNVLSGDMSFVGPHAPTVSAYLNYSKERRNNLCIRPGITGLWAREERSVKLNQEERNYIENWSLWRDAFLLVEISFRYLTGQSILNKQEKRKEDRKKEEIELIRAYNEFKKPLEYDRTLYKPKHGIFYYVYLFIKRLFDFVSSGLAIILLSPVLLVLALLIMSDDGGSPIYGHERIGQNGKRLRVYKFRSMRKDAGDLRKLLNPEQLEQFQTEFKIDNDPRITKIGAFIRRTSIDELPQLFNIFIGNMSVIGPRPIVEEETKIYGDEIGKLLSVKPGLTGYWQAYARNNATYESGERQAMEMYYIDHQGLWLDIRIFFKTIVSVFKKEGAK